MDEKTPQIVLTADQEAVLNSTTDPVTICRSDGSVAGVISPQSPFIAPKICPFTPEEIAEAIKESEGPGPFYSTQEVLEYLRSLAPQQP
jgi:hypothetical protein